MSVVGGGATVLVTGGSGFVGAPTVRRLLESGASVAIVDDLSVGHRRTIEPLLNDVSLFEVDIRDGERLASVFASVRPTAVVHLAAFHFIPACNANPKRCVDINVGGTQSVLDACERADVPAIALASTAAVYAPSCEPHTESSPVGPNDIYGISKLAAEQLADLHHRRTGCTTAVARLFNVFGPRETNAHLIPEVLAQSIGGGELSLGNLGTSRDYVYVDDVADAFYRLLNSTSPHEIMTVNVGTGTSVSGFDLIAAVGDVIGRQVSWRRDPARTRASDRPHLQSDPRLAAAAVGWTPRTTLSDGLRAALEAPFA